MRELSTINLLNIRTFLLRTALSEDFEGWMITEEEKAAALRVPCFAGEWVEMGDLLIKGTMRQGGKVFEVKDKTETIAHHSVILR